MMKFTTISLDEAETAVVVEALTRGAVRLDQMSGEPQGLSSSHRQELTARAIEYRALADRFTKATP